MNEQFIDHYVQAFHFHMLAIYLTLGIVVGWLGMLSELVIAPSPYATLELFLPIEFRMMIYFAVIVLVATPFAHPAAVAWSKIHSQQGVDAS